MLALLILIGVAIALIGVALCLPHVTSGYRRLRHVYRTVTSDRPFRFEFKFASSTFVMFRSASESGFRLAPTPIIVEPVPPVVTVTPVREPTPEEKARAIAIERAQAAYAARVAAAEAARQATEEQVEEECNTFIDALQEGYDAACEAAQERRDERHAAAQEAFDAETEAAEEEWYASTSLAEELHTTTEEEARNLLWQRRQDAEDLYNATVREADEELRQALDAIAVENPEAQA